MRTFVDFMEKYKVVCANVIIENPTLFLGDFYSALDKKWQYKNQIVAVLTVARDLNIDPAPGIAHKVVDALDEPSYDLS
jgi:ribosome-interacting GTPase 1